MSVPPNPANWPAWYNSKTINESLFCQEYLATHQLLYTEQAFFTPKGCMTDETPLKESMEQMNTLMKRYKIAFTDTKQENAALHAENEDLARQLEAASKVSVREQLQQAQIVREYERARQLLGRIPPEVIKTYTASAHKSAPTKETVINKHQQGVPDANQSPR